MSDEARSSNPDSSQDELTVLDLFKSVFKDWRSLFAFIGSIFDAAQREKLSRSLVEERPLLEDASLEVVSPGEEAGFPWRSLTGLALAILAQIQFEPQGVQLVLGSLSIEKGERNIPLVLGLYAVSAALILWGVLKEEWKLPSLLPSREGADPATVRAIAFVLAILLSVAAFLGFSGNLFTPANVSVWLIAVIGFVYSLWIPYRKVRRPQNQDTRRQKFVWGVLILAASLVVIFFRVYRLGDVPSEPFSDHAEKILDVYDVTQGNTHIFFPRNTGREAIQMYWTVLVSWVFGTGLSFQSLKIGTVLFGLLTLPYMYLLGREVGGRRVGLLALIFTGIGYWPNVISRAGLRFPLYPLFTAPTLYYLLHGLRTRNRNDFILSGLFLGFGLHGYSPIRILPFVIVSAVGLYIVHVKSKSDQKNALLWLVILGFTSLAGFIPLLRYWVDSPDAFSYRAFTRLGGVEQPLPGPVGKIFLSNLWNAMRMFNYDDGSIWVHSVTHRPALDVVSGVLFLIGVLLLLVRYFRKRHWQDLFLLLSIPLLSMPSILSLAFPDENPALNRASGAYVSVFVIVALALDGLLAALKHGKMRSRLAWGLGITLIAVSGVQNYDLIFRQYAGQFDSGAWNSSEMGAVIKEFDEQYGRTDTVWIVPFPFWVDTRLPGVWAGIPNRDFAMWRDNLPDTLELQGPKLFIVKANVKKPKDNDQETLDVLKKMYPQGAIRLHRSDVPGHEFWIFSVP